MKSLFKKLDRELPNRYSPIGDFHNQLKAGDKIFTQPHFGEYIEYYIVKRRSANMIYCYATFLSIEDSGDTRLYKDCFWGGEDFEVPI